jgi:hypothetical protein
MVNSWKARDSLNINYFLGKTTDYSVTYINFWKKKAFKGNNLCAD